jgi:hypothetical protein
MGLTNAECQRRWRARHKAESFKHLEQLRVTRRMAAKRQTGYGKWSSGVSGEEASQSGADDTVSTCYESPTESDYRQDGAPPITWNPHQVVEVACDAKRNPHAHDGVYNPTMGRSPEKRGKDALRYLALCVDCPLAFRRTIDTVPDSTIRRICDAVLNVTEGDARDTLTPEQRRLCNKYQRSITTLLDPKKSLKAKRSLLRSANKQAGASVFVPFVLQAALDTLGSALIPTNQ